MSRRYVSVIGEDSHRFEPEQSSKALVLGGISLPGYPGLAGNSDADVILHAIANAITALTGELILGSLADQLCQAGIKDSSVYLVEGLKSLKSWDLEYLSISVEAQRPRLKEHREAICQNIASLLALEASQVNLTATSGEELSDFGRGLGIRVTVILTASQERGY